MKKLIEIVIVASLLVSYPASSEAATAKVFVTYDKAKAGHSKIRKVIKALKSARFRVIAMAATVRSRNLQTKLVIRKELAPALKKDIRKTIMKAWGSKITIVEKRGPLPSEKSGISSGIVAELFLYKLP